MSLAEGVDKASWSEAHPDFCTPHTSVLKSFLLEGEGWRGPAPGAHGATRLREPKSSFSIDPAKTVPIISKSSVEALEPPAPQGFFTVPPSFKISRRPGPVWAQPIPMYFFRTGSWGPMLPLRQRGRRGIRLKTYESWSSSCAALQVELTPEGRQQSYEAGLAPSAEVEECPGGNRHNFSFTPHEHTAPYRQTCRDTCIHSYTHAHAHWNRQIDIYRCRYIYFLDMLMAYAYTYIYKRSHTHVCMNKCLWIIVLHRHASIYIYIYIYIYTYIDCMNILKCMCQASVNAV